MAGTIFKAVFFVLLVLPAKMLVGLLMLFINHNTTITEQGRRNEVRKQNDEIRRLRLKEARKRDARSHVIDD